MTLTNQSTLTRLFVKKNIFPQKRQFSRQYAVWGRPGGGLWLGGTRRSLLIRFRANYNKDNNLPTNFDAETLSDEKLFKKSNFDATNRRYNCSAMPVRNCVVACMLSRFLWWLLCAPSVDTHTQNKSRMSREKLRQLFVVENCDLCI